MSTLPGDPNDVIVSMNYYDQDGTSFVDLFDNPVLGWTIGENEASRPVVTGSLPPLSSSLGSPQWAHIHADSLYVPDMWRGRVIDFFAWLATAGGTNRKLRGNFRHPSLVSAMNNWSQNYPDQFNDRAF